MRTRVDTWKDVSAKNRLDSVETKPIREQISFNTSIKQESKEIVSEDTRLEWKNF